MDEHGDAARALAALPGVARAAGVTDYRVCPAEVAENELRAARLAGAKMIARGMPAYPRMLTDLADAPPFFWALGRTDLLQMPAVALVGARNASSLGTRMARGLAGELGAAGLIVVSGLARGIDAAAHVAALDTGTIAVTAGGVDVVYPAENAVLAQEIAETGLRISEQPMGLQPQARHFPRRNRLISGLACAVVVVEAAAKSGSLITARDALDQGREVMAVPGHPFDARAAGCNMLIRDGATLVRGGRDVIETLGAVPGQAPAQPALIEMDALAQTPALPPGKGPAKAPVQITPQTPVPSAAMAGSADEPNRRSNGAERGAERAAPSPAVPQAGDPAPAKRDGRAGLRTVAALHRQILDRLGPSPLAEDQLIRDLGLSAARVTPELTTLELDGKIARHAGGFVSRPH